MLGAGSGERPTEALCRLLDSSELRLVDALPDLSPAQLATSAAPCALGPAGQVTAAQRSGRVCQVHTPMDPGLWN